MPTFPRATDAKPRLITMPVFPSSLSAWSFSGKGQFRAVQNMGRVWQEVYPNMRISLNSVRALLEAINEGLRGGLVWDVQHLALLTTLGIGGGTPLVNGAGQTGSNLNIDGCGNNKTPYLRRGDLIQVTGCAVVFDVTADCNSNGSGQTVVPINPPIFAGKSPADNAAVTLAPSINFKAVLTLDSGFPQIDVPAGIMLAGLTLNWREQPQ